MIIVISVVVTIAVILFTLSVRGKDLPAPEPVSPAAHLDERKAAIYDNLRDLQFEYRVGKLSDQDYQQTKLDLQRELASVLAEVDKLNPGAGKSAPPQASAAKPPEAPKPGAVCPSCGAKFEQALKFCGECGSPMTEVRA